MDETNEKYTKSDWDKNIANLITELVENRKKEFETLKNVKINKEKNENIDGNK